MALPFSNTVDRTLERLRNAFIETARGAREVVGAPLRPDLPDDDIPRLKSRIDACLEGKGGETARRGRAAELGQAYLSLSPARRARRQWPRSSAGAPPRSRPAPSSARSSRRRCICCASSWACRRA